MASSPTRRRTTRQHPQTRMPGRPALEPARDQVGRPEVSHRPLGGRAFVEPWVPAPRRRSPGGRQPRPNGRRTARRGRRVGQVLEVSLDRVGAQPSHRSCGVPLPSGLPPVPAAEPCQRAARPEPASPTAVRRVDLASAPPLAAACVSPAPRCHGRPATRPAPVGAGPGRPYPRAVERAAPRSAIAADDGVAVSRPAASTESRSRSRLPFSRSARHRHT